ncbi:hypothetical protein [Zwartia vadi]|uniref:hypothetical protein n=1 Tax=Zwartia vadi TaxID=3058168 RepID=UPI0025B59434|nr:hypothetical protein [Zwartia vadi]MDN3987956.1 hypothetical protein [Zwartia vadi]
MSKATANKPIPVSALEYRPRDYFGRYDLQAQLLSSVKGRVRRALIKDALETGETDTLPDFVTTPELDTLDRQILGSLHPMFMGGEYLPKIKFNEVEIARISLRSTTYDVSVLYARPVGQRIHYRVVDEYEGETLQEPSKRTSTKPLTMGEMIDFFITAWSLMDCLEVNFDDDVEGMLGFFSAESEFYPCFDQTVREMVLERFPKRENEDET